MGNANWRDFSIHCTRSGISLPVLQPWLSLAAWPKEATVSPSFLPVSNGSNKRTSSSLRIVAGCSSPYLQSQHGGAKGLEVSQNYIVGPCLSKENTYYTYLVQVWEVKDSFAGLGSPWTKWALGIKCLSLCWWHRVLIPLSYLCGLWPAFLKQFLR